MLDHLTNSIPSISPKHNYVTHTFNLLQPYNSIDQFTKALRPLQFLALFNLAEHIYTHQHSSPRLLYATVEPNEQMTLRRAPRGTRQKLADTAHQT